MKRVFRNTVSVVLCAAMILGITISASARDLYVPEAEWAADIPAMLAAGSYVEGEVVAGVILRNGRVSGNELLAESEEIMDASEAEDDLLSGKAPVDGELHIVYIQRDDLSTEEILYKLSRDSRVLFAEPNYLTETETADVPDEDTPEGTLDEGNHEETPAPEESGDSLLPASDEDIPAETPAPEESGNFQLPAAGETIKMENTENQDDEPSLKFMEKVTIRTDNFADLTQLQWNSADLGGFRLKGDSGNSINVPHFDDQTGNMTGEPVVVAVLDSALAFDNPDLGKSAYTFTPEQRQILGCDVHGYNATSESTDGTLVYAKNDSGAHSSHCGGIIGAAWDGQGISGIASNVQLVSIQNCDTQGYITLVSCLRGFDFVDRANENGCPISLTSSSWGLSQGTLALDAAVRTVGEKWGVLSFFSAGNDSRDNAYYGYIKYTLFDNPYAIIVAATDVAGNRAPYSNYGDITVDFGAPGSGILSSIIPAKECGRFFADAIPEEERVFYEGFEGAADSVQVRWVKIEADEEGQQTIIPLDTDASVTEDSCFAGGRSLQVRLNPDAKNTDMKGNAYYIMQLDFGDLSENEAIQPGTLMGFVLGGKGAISIGSFSVMNKEGCPENLLSDSGGNANLGADTFSDGWISSFIEIPEDADLSHFVVWINVGAQNIEEIFLDSFGFGNEVVPYTLFDGTSMAAPAACGAAAVIKARTGATNAERAAGTELAALVRASVRPSDAMAGITRTGGIIDLSVTDPDVSPESALVPSIRTVNISGNTLTIEGSNFTENGTVQVSKIVAGLEPERKDFVVSYWSEDKVVLTAEEKTTGILEVVLKNKDERTDTSVCFAGKSENLFEEDLPFDTSTGDPYLIDANRDYETNGPLIGLGDKLYYLPIVDYSFFRTFRCFDIASKTWSDLAPLPEWLTYVSAVMYNGKIVVKGSTVDLAPDGSPFEKEDAQQKIYVYDPAKNSWSGGSAENVDVKDTIANYNGQLIMVGGGGDQRMDPETGEYITENASVKLYDLETGTGDKLVYLSDIYFRPSVACANGTIYIFDEATYKFERVINGKAELLENALPEYYTSVLFEQLRDSGYPRGTERGGVLVPVSEGVLFLGPLAKDGSGDTFLLRNGSDKFETYERRMTDSRALFTAAASYRGYVYAIGSAPYEPDKTFFRRTAISVPEYAGDIVDPENIPDNKTPVTGDAEKANMWMIILISSAALICGIGTVAVKRKKGNSK